MNVEQVKALFSISFCDLLTFEQQGEYVVIKPRQFLENGIFAEIAQIVRANNGEYISVGKESCFRIPVESKPAQEKFASPVSEKTSTSSPVSLHFKVSKLTVSLGTTVQNGEKEWVKQSYELEVEVNSDTLDVVEKAKAEAEQLVQSWLSEPPLSSVTVPDLDVAELNTLPWVTYKTKKPAQNNEAGWIFTNVKGGEKLVAALNRSSDKKLVHGNMAYSFSGEGNMFVSRKPTNTKN